MVDASPRKALKIGLVVFAVFAAAIFVFSYLGVYAIAPMSGERVALVRVEGPIMDARDAVDAIHAYQKDDRVRALVLRVDSPGGGVVASQEIHDAVVEFRESGRVVVTSMGTVAASGGYYVAAPSDLILANPGTLTGSIGVIMSMANFEGLLEKVGVQSVTIKAGKNKDIGSPFREMTAPERRILQGVIDDIHDQFIEAVARGRGREIAEIRPLADGRIFTGKQAVAEGLVDELGNLDTAIARAGELAGISGKPKVLERKESPLDRFLAGAESLVPWPRAGASGRSGVQAMYLMSP